MFEPLQAFATERILLPILAVLYGLSFVFYCPPHTRNPKTGRIIKRIGFIFHLLAVVLQAFLIFLRVMITAHAPFEGIYEMFLVLSFGVSLTFLVLSWHRDTFGYGRAAAFSSWLLVFVMLLMHFFKPEAVVPRYLKAILQSNTWFQTHVIFAVLAYSLFTLAFFAALTSLGRKEEILSKTRAVAEFYLWPGVILFTISLALGASASRLAWGQWWIFEPKQMLSVVTWSAFVLALAVNGERNTGKKFFPWLVIIGFVLMIFTLFFTNKGLHDFI